MAKKYFGRRLYNRICGRRNFKEENLNLETARELLRYFTTQNHIKGEMMYYHPAKREVFRKPIIPPRKHRKSIVSPRQPRFFQTPKTPSEVYGFFSTAFQFGKLYPDIIGYYLEGNHQVYFNDKKEIHYIEIVLGAFTKKENPTDKEEQFAKERYKKMTLEILVKKP